MDRQDWVAAAELRVSERLQANGHTVIVLRMEERGEEPVFNLEVDAEHCYRVGEQGVLVHNQSTPKTDPCSMQKLTPGNADWNRDKTVNVIDRRDYTNTNSTMCVTPCPNATPIPTNVVVEAFALLDKKHPTIGTGSGTDIPARRWSGCLVGMPDDDAGHVIGNALGGSGKLADGNIFPQDQGINRGLFRDRDRLVRRAIEESCRVCIDISFNYPKGGNYPGRPKQKNGIVYDVYVNYVKNLKNPIDFDNSYIKAYCEQANR